MFIKLSKSDRGDVILSLCAVAQAFLAVVQLLLNDAGVTTLDQAAKFRVLCSAGLILLALPIMLKRNAKLFLGLYLIVGILFLFSLLYNSGNGDYIMKDGLRLTLAICLPTLISFASIINYNIFLTTLRYFCFATFGIGVIYAVMLVRGMLFLEDFYNMSFGYAMLLPIMYFWFTRSIWLRVLSLVLAVVVFFIGSRGPFLVFGIYVLFDYLKESKPVYFVIGGILALFIFLNLEGILLYLENIFGFESRTTSLLLSGELVSHTSGREEIYKVAEKMIIQSPILGYGIYGARPALGGVFPHNIALEIWLDFGVFLGTLFILALLICTFRAYFKSDPENRRFFSMITIASVVPLFVSGSYIMDYNFFFFLGVLCVYLKKKTIVTSKI